MSSDTAYVRGAEKLSRRIKTIRETLLIGPMVNEIGQLLLRRTLRRFDEEVDPDNRPWTPLKDASLARRGRANARQSGKILVQTGAMRSSIRLIRGSISGAVFTNTGAGVRIGITDPAQVDKARAHNYGTPTIPQRRFLGIGALDVRSVDSFLRRRASSIE